MTPAQPIHRKTLNPNQLQILYLLYKFRFGTTDLFVKSHNTSISRQYIHTRLHILYEQEYIGRTYDNSYKLKGQPASYHLLSKGIKLLKQRPDDFNAKVLRNAARDKDRSDGFMQHCLGIFAIYNHCKQVYGDELQFYTKSYLTERDKFPQPLPDAYVALKSDRTKQFLLESLESATQFFVIKRRIRYYVDYAEDEKWPKSRPFPGIFFVCDTDKLKQATAAYAAKRFGRTWKDIPYAVCTRAELATNNNLFSFRK